MLFRFGSTQIAVNIPTRDALLAAVSQRLANRQGFALATINLDHLVKLRRSARFRSAYAAQDLVVADGNPIVWLSRLARAPVTLVPGSDMIVPMAAAAADAGVSVALIGTTPDALDAAARRLQAAVPGLTIGWQHAPETGFDAASEAATGILTEVAARQIGLCFLALGAPRQEELSARGRQIAPQTGFASIGAGLDFLAGTQRRAPLWVRQFAVEWLWRTVTSPRRMIPRYVACAAILPGQVVAALRQR